MQGLEVHWVLILCSYFLYIETFLPRGRLLKEMKETHRAPHLSKTHELGQKRGLSH